MAAKLKSKKKKKSSKKSAAKKKSSAAKRSSTAVDSIADKVTSLGRDAVTAAERRQTLDWALNLPWAASDIALVERVDVAAFHGWEMTPR
jgi:hypothetical protein